MLSKLKPSVSWQRFASFDFIDSRTGKFHTRKGTFDAICASPDYEYPDVKALVNLISSARSAGKRVWFMDIGANIGVFTVRIGNYFKGDDGVEFLGFEPFLQSYDLYVRNITANSLNHRCRAFNCGLSNLEGEVELAINSLDAGSNSMMGASELQASRSRVQVTTLDSLVDSLGAEELPEVLIVKLDVEGAEKLMIEGGVKTFGRVTEIHLLVEDFLDSSLADFLRSSGFVFQKKSTPYNSLWIKNNT